MKKNIINKKKQNNKNVDTNLLKVLKVKKILRIVFIVSISIVLIELIIMYLINLSRENKITYIDTLNSINKVDDYYLVTGSSNFKYSKYNNSFIFEYEDGVQKGLTNRVYAEQAKLVKLDKELNVVFEKTFKTDYHSIFYDAKVANNSIYAVGNYVYEKKQLSINTTDGLIVKYDLDGNIIWSKNFQILGDTKFKKILVEDDGLIVIGQSIFENFEIPTGNYNVGGGIIVKYDFDGNIIWTNNFGGNKSAILNDIVKVDDGYIAVGKDAVNYGMIIKFNFNGDRIWVKNYSNTDTYGMSSVKLKDNKLYIAGAYNKSEEKDKDGKTIFEYDACIFVYDLNGELLDIYKIEGNKDDRFNNLLLLDNSLIAVGYTCSSDIDIKGLKYQKNMTEGMLIEFDYEGNIIRKEVYGGSKNESLNDIIIGFDDQDNIINNTKSYIVVGYTNSKRKIFVGNNKDYFSKVLKYDQKLNLEMEK